MSYVGRKYVGRKGDILAKNARKGQGLQGMSSSYSAMGRRLENNQIHEIQVRQTVS